TAENIFSTQGASHSSRDNPHSMKVVIQTVMAHFQSEESYCSPVIFFKSACSLPSNPTCNGTHCNT
ncbi:hypothetical protein L9F63_022128, partial [Diploptera punctata]